MTPISGGRAITVAWRSRSHERVQLNMSSEAGLFTLEEERWYAWQMLPGYGSMGHYYSPVRISRVEPKKRGDGTLMLEFYNAGYAAGVRTFELELRVLLRSREYVVAAIEGEQTHADTRSVIVSPVDMGWLEKHSADFLRRHPPTESERQSRDANDFLDRLMGEGSI